MINLYFENVRKMAEEDVLTWLNESPETLNDCLENPGDWSENLINAIGEKETAKLFDVELDSDNYFKACCIYNDQANLTVQKYKTDIEKELRQ